MKKAGLLQGSGGSWKELLEVGLVDHVAQGYLSSAAVEVGPDKSIRDFRRGRYRLAERA